MNQISPKKLMQSKWTKTTVQNKEKHFLVTLVKLDEQQNVIDCVIEAVINRKQYAIDWRELKNNEQWRMGWQ